VSLPFQFNFNSGGDLEDQTSLNLNFQPVIPIKLNPRWSLIARTIVPINSAPVGVNARSSGVGDVQEQLYITPAVPGKIIWGIGPMLSLPTATADASRTGSWAMGPGAVILAMHGHWVYGGLIQQFWTMADTGGDPEINQFVLQPFLNYNFGQGWALGFGPIITANWNAASDQEWTVPLGLGISRTTVFNGRPIQLGIQYYHNVIRPDGSPSTQLRMIVSLLYPTKK
jgi:hypothetical protein